MALQERKSLKFYHLKDYKISVNNRSSNSIDVEINDDDTISINGKIYQLEKRNTFLMEHDGNLLVFHSRKEVLNLLWKRKIGIWVLVIALLIFICIILKKAQ